MRDFKIKICGISSIKALQASRRADYIGFVFYPKSPRFVNADKAYKLCEYCDTQQKKVGLFVDSDINLISYLNEKLDLDYIQLHGNETIEEITSLKKKIGRTKIIKSIGIREKKDLQLSYAYENIADMLLLDTKYEASDIPGGNGVGFNWEILKEFNPKKDWMLAGGIKYSNLEKCLKKTKAPIIDISSGLEYEKGKKSVRKINNFLNLAESIR